MSGKSAAKKPQIVVRQPDSDNENDYEDYSEEEGDEGYANITSKTTNLQQQQQNIQQQELDAEHKLKEVDMKWDTVKWHFDQVIDLNNDYVQEGAKGGIFLSKNGVITLSAQDGTLQLGTHSNEQDFMIKVVSQSLNNDGKSSKMKKKVVVEPMNCDIVKSVYLTNFHVEGYDNRIVAGLPTVPKYQGEGHFGASSTVNEHIWPDEHKVLNNRIKLCDRGVNNAMIEFQERNPGYSPENLANGIQKPNKGFCLVDFDSPIIKAINKVFAAHVEGGQYLVASLPDTNQVLVREDIVKTFKTKTLKSMSHSISYGNVTDRMQLSFAAPIPPHLLNKHKQFEVSEGQYGRQSLGFADPCHNNMLDLSAHNENVKTKSALFKNNVSHAIRISGTVETKYKRSTRSNAQDSL